MDKAYNRIVWVNQPSTSTALGATNLNKMDVALNAIDDRVVGMDTSKANQSTVNGVVHSITYNESTGVLTITKVNGTSTTIDTKLEKLAVNFAYNPTTQQLDITLDDGTVQHVDMSALVTQYEFDNTGTIAFTLTAGRVTANVVNGSITAEKLHPDYLANLTVQAQIAEENKNIAIEQAGIATDAADDAETYRDQALQYRNEAEGIVGVGIATESVPGLVKGAGNVSVRTNGDMWADPYKDKATLTGPSAQFPTADNGLIEIISIQGKYSQAVTVQGKQLFDKAKVSAVKYIQPVTGTETTSSFNNNASAKIYTGTETNVTISGHTYVQPNTPVGIAFYNSSNARIGGTSYQNATGNGTYAIPAGTFYLRYTINNVDLNTSQAEFGTVATSYAAYIPNSPSPDYPSVIHNVGDVPFEAGACGKNILQNTSTTLVTNGITFTVNADKSVTINGISTATAVITLNNLLKLPLGTYTLSGIPSNSLNITVEFKHGSVNGTAITSANYTNKTFTLSSYLEDGYIYIRVPSGVTVNNLIVYPQLEPGSVSTPYEPYKGNQTPVTGQYGALPDGTYDEMTPEKDIKRKGRVIYDGSVDENWTLQSINSYGITNFGIPLTHKSTGANNTALCTWGGQQTSGISTTQTEGFILSAGNTLYLRIKQTTASTVSQLRLLLAANPMVADYPLVTPIEAPRDRIFLTSYPGTTNVYTTDPLQPIFTAVAKSELWSDRRNYLLSLDYDTPHYYYEGKKYLINNPYRFGGVLHLKGQMHCHTTNSDGANSPTDLVTAYKNAGYDFITITDHNVVTPDPGVSGITWIGNSVEESYLRHVNAFDVGTDYSGLQSTQDVMSYHKNKGRMTSLNHPNWKNQYILEEFEVKSYYDHNFIEVYNSVVNAYAEEQWDYALSSNRIVFGTAVDDCHNVSAFAFNKGWVVVHTNTNTNIGILQSLRNGNFYASTGNDISIALDDNIITTSSIAASNFTFIGRNGRVLKTESGVTSATYTILGDESYVRVKSELASDLTKKAFSQPIFIETMREQYQYSDIYKNIVLSGINRQALDNGGFDVWERGTSFDFGNTTGAKITADRWIYTQNSDTATIPETTVEKSTMPLDYVPLASNVYRINFNTVGNTSTSTNHYAALTQMIEEGAKNLCAMSKKITTSFYARSSISGKKIATEFRLNYGTGGSPSTQVDIPGKVISLTDYWKKHSVTVTLPEVAGSVFGTNNDSYLRLSIWNYWGSAYNSRLGASSAEFPTSTGTVEFMAMTLNSTDLQLPYMPKGCTEESRNCQRHYTHNKEIDSSATLYYMAIDATTLLCNYQFPQTMMKTPTVNVSFGGVDKRIRKASDGTLLDATTVSVAVNKNMIVLITLTGVTLTAGNYYQFNITAETGY